MMNDNRHEVRRLVPPLIVDRQRAFAFGQLIKPSGSFARVAAQAKQDWSYFIRLAAAMRAIDAKASEPGSPSGTPTSDYDEVPGGFVRRYSGCDIYYSEATSAHEVHGEIKAKYDALGGPTSALGFPTTDEMRSPDGVGRYNYFANGAIFWTAHTGPMMMSRAVVDCWLSNGAQNTLGYPVIDQYHFRPPTPSQDSHTQWCAFENGAIGLTPDGVAVALAATLKPGDLRAIIRARFDSEVHKSGDNVGLHPEVETAAVSGWSHGFWASIPRQITFRLHGFRDNGLAPDTNFRIDIGLQFELVAPLTFYEPAMKSLVATLVYLRVRYDEGWDEIYVTAPGQVVKGVASGIYKAFYPDVWPDAARPEIPDGSLFVADVTMIANPQRSTDHHDVELIDVFDVMASADGGLQVLVNPLPVGPPTNFGLLRKNLAQGVLDGMVP